MGLVFSGPHFRAGRGRHLAYGRDFGALIWAPDWFKHAIVHVWNWIVCHLFGHDVLRLGRTIVGNGYHVQAHAACIACSKKFPPPTDLPEIDLSNEDPVP